MSLFFKDIWGDKWHTSFMILYFKQWHHNKVTGNNDVSLDITVQVVKVVPIHVLQVTRITPIFFTRILITLLGS